MSQYIPDLIAQSLDLYEHYSKNTRRADIDFPQMPGTRTRTTTTTSKRTKRTRSKPGVGFKQASVKAKQLSMRKDYFKYHISGFPQKQVEVLRYTVLIPAAALATRTYTESYVVLNGPYDPDTSGGAAQPAGWAKLMAVYTKCYVRAARIKAFFTLTPSAGLVSPFTAGVTITTNATSLSSAEQAINSGICEYRQMNTNQDVCTIDMTCDMRQFLGIKNGEDGSTQYVCTPASNPGQVVVAHLWGFNNGSTTASSFNCNYTVDYDCVFYDPIPVT